MSAVRTALALLLAARWGAWALQVSGPQAAPNSASGPPDNAPLPSNASDPWRDELRSLALRIRVACGTGDSISCADMIQKLQAHVWEQLKDEAAKLRAPHPRTPPVKVVNGDGIHVRLPTCVNGSGMQEAVPELAYRHVFKTAGYQIIMNMNKFATGEAAVHYNFPRNYYAEFNRHKPAFSFTFTRQPLARFISGYTEMEEWKWSRRSKFEKGTTDRALDFVRGLLRDGFYNDHMALQVSFHLSHYEGAHRPFDFVGRLEDFEEGWRRVQDMCNCSGRLGPWDYKLGGHMSSRRKVTRKAMNDAIGQDYRPDWGNVQRSIKDRHPSAWFTLGIDPHAGFEDSISACANETHPSMAPMDSLAMRDLLLSPGGAALRAVCLLLLPDYYALSYPLPSGCEHLSV